MDELLTSESFAELTERATETEKQHIIIRKNKVMEAWMTSTSNNNDIKTAIGEVDMTIHPLLSSAYDDWENNSLS